MAWCIAFFMLGNLFRHNFIDSIEIWINSHCVILKRRFVRLIGRWDGVLGQWNASPLFEAREEKNQLSYDQVQLHHIIWCLEEVSLSLSLPPFLLPSFLPSLSLSLSLSFFLSHWRLHTSFVFLSRAETAHHVAVVFSFNSAYPFLFLFEFFRLLLWRQLTGETLRIAAKYARLKEKASSHPVNSCCCSRYHQLGACWRWHLDSAGSFRNIFRFPTQSSWLTSDLMITLGCCQV